MGERKYEALDTETVAELLGVTARQVRNWVKDKGLPSRDDARGRRFIWRDTLEWYVSYRAEKDGSRGSQAPPEPAADETESLEEATTRKTIAEADLKELELATKRGEVVAIADAERTIATIAKNIQQKLLAVASKLTSRLVGTTDRNRINAILDGEMRSLCAELAATTIQPPKRQQDPEDEE